PPLRRAGAPVRETPSFLAESKSHSPESTMGLFSKITDRILGRKAPAASTPPPAATPEVIIFDGSKDDPQVAPPALMEAAPPAPEPVDVEAVLTAIAEEKGGKSDWRRSIVD